MEKAQTWQGKLEAVKCCINGRINKIGESESRKKGHSLPLFQDESFADT